MTLSERDVAWGRGLLDDPGGSAAGGSVAGGSGRKRRRAASASDDGRVAKRRPESGQRATWIVLNLTRC